MRSIARLIVVGLLAVTPHLRAACPDFNLPRNYPVGAEPRIPVIADFNGDTRSDLAVTNWSTNDVSILIGNGGGSFQPPVNYPAGSNPNGIAIGDLNGDGKMDLAVGNYSSADVSILFGNGDGTFQAAVNIATNAGAPGWLVLADFNNDSKLDLVVLQNNDLGILLGNGDGTFGAETPVFVGTPSFALTVADFNGDSKPDLATANYGAQSASVLLGNGDGTFAAATSYFVNANATNVKSDDFNGDGKADLIVASVYGTQILGAVSIFLGNGDGTFGTRLDNGTGQPDVSQMAIGDFNSDGKKDVVMINSGSNTFTVFRGQGDGTLVSIGLFPAGYIPFGVLTSDLDGDGKLDLIVANFYSTDVSVFAGNGNGTFATAASILYSGNFIAAGDFDADGKRDVTLAGWESGFINLSYLLGAGDGSFSFSDSDQFASSPPTAVVAADFNGDAKIDVVLSTFDPSLAVSLGNGDGTFGAAAIS